MKKEEFTNLNFLDKVWGTVIKIWLLGSKLMQVKLFPLGIIIPCWSLKNANLFKSTYH